MRPANSEDTNSDDVNDEEHIYLRIWYGTIDAGKIMLSCDAGNDSCLRLSAGGVLK